MHSRPHRDTWHKSATGPCDTGAVAPTDGPARVYPSDSAIYEADGHEEWSTLAADPSFALAADFALCLGLSDVGSTVADEIERRATWRR